MFDEFYRVTSLTEHSRFICPEIFGPCLSLRRGDVKEKPHSDSSLLLLASAVIALSQTQPG
jgi:hypothetical protein